MDAQTLWQHYCLMNQAAPQKCPEAFQFGVSADELAALVYDGIKTATSSAYDLYELEQESLPQVGDYAIVLNACNEAQCIIRTTAVNVVPFNEVSEAFAFLEGEGDRTLAYWRKVHEQFWREELKGAELIFTPEMRVVCEEFEVVYRA